MTGCARACTTARRHSTDCPNQDTCPGCLPRDATHGLLCTGCHTRLEDWLKNAPFQHFCLLAEAEPSLSQDLSDATGGGDVDAPTPLNLAAAAAATTLTDILSAWVEMLAEQYDMRGPTQLLTRDQIENPQGRQLNPRWSRWVGESVWCDPPAVFEISSACRWLTAQLGRLEYCAGIGDLWDELGEAMGHAHALAPWREEAARLNGIECPECHRAALVRYGGSENVTCQRCNAHITPGRYAIWVRQLASERTEAS